MDRAARQRAETRVPTTRPPGTRHMPQPPPMQVVTKGWWSRPDEAATADELEHSDEEEAARK